MPPELAPWLNYGVAGLVIAAMLAGLLVTKGHADEIRAQRTEAINGWKAQTDATKELTGVVREQAATIADLKTQVATLVQREVAGRRGS